ncbi:MAG: transcription antitermination factor NusB [Candidatus Endonucleobacter sp. (ex Gigantidas childressi)]|nr:transcription antitermination factor NusB [Candidatus Endonucleobacter sp. (ex Gigantidas childressi)]
MVQQSEKKDSPPMPSARRRARQLALQALYQWQIAQSPIASIESQFMSDNDMDKVDSSYFSLILHGVPRQVSDLDEAIAILLDREITRLDPIELTALRIGCYELVSQPSVPYRVVINEAIGLAKKFGAQDSHRYINSILDKLAHKLRVNEVRSYQKC